MNARTKFEWWHTMEKPDFAFLKTQSIPILNL